MTTNVPPVVFTPEGLEVPQEAAILAGVQADYNEAFGGNLNPALNTPQGQLASSTAAIVADANATLAEFVNQVNPDTADGFMQDAIARIYFLERSPGAPTVVACTCLGDFGTVIPIGAQAQDTSGNRYVCIDGGTIPVSGTIVLNFANTVDGPIPCPPDTLTIIYRAIPGWDTINNVGSGVLGRLVESRAEFEFRRENSVALNAHGSKESIYAAVFDVEDVLDVFVTENVTDVIVPYGSTNYDLAPHSVYVGVVGGDADAIGQAIYTKKDLGCNMNGNTTVVVTDNSYTPPKPTYEITFNRPTELPIFFRVELTDSAGLPSDIEAQVKAAIIAAFNGADGSARIRIGGLILASKFVGPVSNIGDEVSILSILIGTVGPGALNSIQAGIDQAPTVDEADITVILTP
jgi:uncharacterized phage protein gp47/JayE